MTCKIVTIGLTIELSPLLNLYFGSIKNQTILPVLSELRLLKPICYIIFLLTCILTMHHDNFVPYSTKFNSITNFQFVALSWIKAVIFIITHMSHDKPKFVTGICLFFFCIFNLISMIEPIIVIFEKAGCCLKFLIGVLLFMTFIAVSYTHLTLPTICSV